MIMIIIGSRRGTGMIIPALPGPLSARPRRGPGSGGGPARAGVTRHRDSHSASHWHGHGDSRPDRDSDPGRRVTESPGRRDRELE